MKFEIAGTLTRDQAVAVAELLGGSSVLWCEGHTYPDGNIVIRPAGCKCPQCSAQETPPEQERHKPSCSVNPPTCSVACDCGEDDRLAALSRPVAHSKSQQKRLEAQTGETVPLPARPCHCANMTINQPMGVPCPDCGRPL